MKKEVAAVWIYAAICYLFLPCFSFVLPLVFSLKRVSLPLFLLLCMASGFFVGFFDSSLPPGVHAAIWLACGALAYKTQRFFFNDKLISIALFSYLVSLLITLLTLKSHGISLNIESVISELLICPIADSLFCLSYFLMRRLFILKMRGAS